MKVLSIIIVFSILFAASTARKIVCYWSSWAVYYGGDGKVDPENLDATLCTHINYAFISMKDDGSLSVDDDWGDVDQEGFKKIVALKEQNPDLKVLLSIGGADAPSQTFASIAASSDKRATMVASARKFIETYGFDGVDIDWEIPGSNDKDNFISLLQDFRNDFDNDGWELSAALSADVQDGYDVPRISEILNHLNIMVYDLYGPWSDYTGQNSALYPAEIESDWEKENLNMESCINQWIDAGAAPEKIIAGIPFYGHSFTLKNPDSDNGLHAAITGAGSGGPFIKEEGSWSYMEWCEYRSSWHCTWDDEQKMPICLNGDQWLGIEDEGSVRNKVAFINRSKLGGAMIWSIDMDDVHGSCGDPNPLLHAIADNLN